MSGHLLAVEVGPVESFIAAARKTRDLWFGSAVMSDVAKAAAFAVQAKGGTLIFPAADDLTNSELTIGDEILASLPAGTPPGVVAAAAKEAVHRAWVDRVRRVKQELSDERVGNSSYFGTYIRDDVWRAQTPETITADTAGEVVECYAAWVPLSGEYAAAQRTLKRLLRGRTACHNFPKAAGVAKLPKSSLDGARETVLEQPPEDEKQSGKWERGRARKLRLNRGEQLDVLGVVRRTDRDAERFPSVARVAVIPWVAGARGTPAFDRLLAECERLAGQQVVTRMGGDRYKDFPYEGAVLFPSRHADIVAEYGADTDEEAKDVARRLAGFRNLLKDCGRGEPNPYYAVLRADGDGVGEASLRCTSQSEHQELAAALSAFTRHARGIVREYAGETVYAGGDDVLAFLPVDRALACAQALQQRFREVWPDVSLSVGVVVAHFLEPFEEVLESARTAEKTAKGYGLPKKAEQKNALAVHHQPRGGAPLTVRMRWDVIPGPVERVHAFADLLRYDQLPDKVAYDLRRLADDYEDGGAWPAAAPATGRAIEADLRRLLGGKSKKAADSLQPFLAGLQSRPALIELANTAILARRVAAAQAQAEGGAT